jgi:two-component system OmpR family response regulator
MARTMPVLAPVALIVEDDDDIRDVLQDVAQRAGFETATARHGLEALRYLRDHAGELPSVILLDLTMPIMDGTSFLDRRVGEERDIPVVVLTARHDASVPPGVRVLRKPVSMEIVLDALCPYSH